MENEYHTNSLKDAVSRLQAYEPDDAVWQEIEAGLREFSLQNAIKEMPVYEPVDQVWDHIDQRLYVQRPSGRVWWLAASVVFAMSLMGLWIWQKGSEQEISYAQEKFDARLLVSIEKNTDAQYDKLKAYCEEEALVCSGKDFRRLTEDYELLREAAQRLEQAMGQYNNEPELIRQFAVLEQEKADVLNKLAKLI